MGSQDDLIAVLEDAGRHLRRAGSDVSWSGWSSVQEAVAEIEAMIGIVRTGADPPARMMLLFAPTGPLQEASMSSGWATEFLDLAYRFDAAWKAYRSTT